MSLDRFPRLGCSSGYKLKPCGLSMPAKTQERVQFVKKRQNGLTRSLAQMDPPINPAKTSKSLRNLSFRGIFELIDSDRALPMPGTAAFRVFSTCF